jgi:arylsulfatase A
MNTTTIRQCFAVLFYFCFTSCMKNQLTDKKDSTGRISNGSVANASIPIEPNMIVFLADDVGYEIPNYTGGISYTTPNINLAAQQGIVYRHCYASPLCSPSRFMLLTGAYNQRNYAVWGMMNPNQKTIANMFHDAGYSTGVFGKWQLNGGITSAKNFGFDNMVVFDPVTTSNIIDDDSNEPRYGNPLIYENGWYWPDSLTKGKYGPDIFLAKALHFMDSCHAIGKKYFIYFSSPLCHTPFAPTPHDKQFKTWIWSLNRSNIAFWPSMVRYMDSIFGVLKYHTDSLDALPGSNKTVIAFMGDNGTPKTITSQWTDPQTGQVISVTGEKGNPTEHGTHVPFFITGLGSGTDNQLVDFTDFVPSLADICNISVPAYIGTPDGHDFGKSLRGLPDTARSLIFCHFDANISSDGGAAASAWVQDTVYKTYSNKIPYLPKSAVFLSIVPTPQLQILQPNMTPTQKAIYNYQAGVLSKDEGH